MASPELPGRRSCATCGKTRRAGGYLIGCRGALLDASKAGRDCADWTRKGAERDARDKT